jgi:GntR family transcriptional regulator, transcriptional repressor for pyruvate dehydrogenase complex
MSNAMKREASTPEFGTFERSVLPEQICERFLLLIEEGRLRPGDKLPAERDLAVMMGVSRPSLREALRALSTMKVIEMRPGDGTYVTSLEPALLVEHLDFVFSLDDSTFLQLLQARKILEPGIAALVAGQISDQELAGMQACLDRTAESMDDHEAFLQADLELHQRIAEAAGNPILGRFMAALSRLGVASRRRTVAIPGIARQTMRDHRAIVRALQSRDAAAAQAAMLHHLEGVQKELEAIAGAESPPADPQTNG